MPPRDAAATRKRILDAAAREFAQHGLAGARVDRIAEAAEANKRMIYAYFGSKDELFDAVVASVIEEIHVAVPLTPDDLAAYAGRLFDYVVERPDIVAIDAWRRLERPGPTAREEELFAAKLDTLGARFPGGRRAKRWTRWMCWSW